MTEPSPRASRLVVAAASLAAIAFAGGGFVIGQRSVIDNAPVVTPAVVALPDAPPPALLPPPKPEVRELGRADLIALAALAADAVASGAAMPAEIDAAVGKRFSIALPFGCAGPAPADSDLAMRWRYDDAAGALRLHISPVAWTPAEWWPQQAPPDLESVEGFWLARPWTSSEACPAPNSAVVPVAAVAAVAAGKAGSVKQPAHTLALGQLFDGTGSRQGRRDGKPYTTVIRMAGADVHAEQGFRLRLVGQIGAAPGGGGVLCRQPEDIAQPPVCMIVTTLDDVSIENTATGETLARWTVAGARAPE